MLCWAGLLAVCVAYAAADTVAEPTGYRQEEYRAPVPETLSGASVADTDLAHDLWETRQAVFIDVLPRAPKPELPEGTVWREAPHPSIPGAIWLPNVGYGALSDQEDDYFRSGLEAATKGDRDHPLLIFCLAECWMSWNAAKRALEYGYADVTWYPGGTDLWAFEGYGLVPVDPWTADE